MEDLSHQHIHSDDGAGSHDCSHPRYWMASLVLALYSTTISEVMVEVGAEKNKG